jgi:predicted Rossmann fold flavoprotein
MGHTIRPPMPSLAPIVVKETWIKELEGLSLKNVSIAVVQNGKKRDERFGEALFTDDGMSGPIVLDMSKTVGELLSQGEVELRIDFKPALDREKLDKRILRDFEESSNRMFRNSLGGLLPQKLIPVMVSLSGIDPDKKVHSITREERQRLIDLLKGFTLRVQTIAGFSKAIVTAGGVDLKEVDPKTMKSKVVENLYLTGEILDLDGPTGGFNLQVAWTTGYMAGDSSGNSLS